MKGKQNPTGGQSLMIIQVQSNYVGVAPILRSLQRMACSDTGIPMAKYLIMSDHDDDDDDDHLPAYLREKR